MNAKPGDAGSNQSILDEAQDLASFEEAKREKGLGFASPVACMLVLANTLLGGSGMLGIPHALSVAGWSLGLCLLALFGSLSAFGSHLLQCSARRIGEAPTSFYSVAQATVPRWTWLIDGAVMVKCFGVGTSYLVIVGDVIPDALHSLGWHGVKRWQVVGLSWVIAGSLACARNLSALRYTALGCLCIVLWTTILSVLFVLGLGGVLDPCDVTSPSAVAAATTVAADGAFPDVTGAPVWAELTAGSRGLPCFGGFGPVEAESFLSLGKALPVFIFAFTCQQNVFSICNEVRQASRRRLDAIISGAYLIAGVAFAVTGVLAYAAYGGAVQPDMLKSYPQGSLPVQATRLLFGILAMLSFPLQVHPSRRSALALWTLIRGPPGAHQGNEQESLAGSGAGQASAERHRFWIATALILAPALMIAVLVTDLGQILGVVGATGSTMVSYVLPGLVYSRAYEGGFKRKAALCQLGLGCIIMPTCLVLVFL